MNKFLLAAIAALFLVGCAGYGASSSSSSASLPEIAPYDEATYEPLPEVVPAE